MAEELELDKNTKLLYESAKALGLEPELLIPEIYGFQIKLGPHYYYFRLLSIPFSLVSAAFFGQNKHCANKVLAKFDIPVPESISLKEKQLDDDAIKEIVAATGLPAVIKPTCGGALGNDVLCNVTEPVQLKKQLKSAFKNHPVMTVESFHRGLRSYRVHVFYGKVIGVVERTPSHVIGNGKSTISELIDETNLGRQKLEDTVSLGMMDKDDPEYAIRLKELGLTLESVPAKDEYVQLCYTCNSTRGGTMHSYGANYIHKDNAKLAKKACDVLGLKSVGFDILCEDILTSHKKSQLIFIEANENADLTIHENAMSGVNNPISRTILKKLIRQHPFYYLMKRLSSGSSQHSSLKLNLLRALLFALPIIIMAYL